MGEVGAEDVVVGAADRLALEPEQGQFLARNLGGVDVAGGSGAEVAASARRATCASVRSPPPAMTSGGAGSCTGRGTWASVARWWLPAKLSGCEPHTPRMTASRLLQGCLPLASRSVRQPHPVELVGAPPVVGGVPADAESEDGAAVAEVVEVRGEACRQQRCSVGLGGDHRPQTNALSRDGKDGEMNPALRCPRRVVAEEERVESVGICQAAGVEQPLAGGAFTVSGHGL